MKGQVSLQVKRHHYHHHHIHHYRIPKVPIYVSDTCLLARLPVCLLALPTGALQADILHSLSALPEVDEPALANGYCRLAIGF